MDYVKLTYQHYFFFQVENAPIPSENTTFSHVQPLNLLKKSECSVLHRFVSYVYLSAGPPERLKFWWGHKVVYFRNCNSKENGYVR